MSTAVAPHLPLAFSATIVDDADDVGTTVLRVSGEIDLFVECALEDALVAAMSDAPAVLVDLDACSFFGSTGLNALSRARRDARARRIGFAVVAPRGGACRFVFDLGVKDSPVLYEDQVSGLAALRSAASSRHPAAGVRDEQRQASPGG